MTVAFTVFDTASGEILRTGNAMTVAQAQLQAGPGEKVITVGTDPLTQVISNPGSDYPGIINKPGSGNLNISVDKTAMLANGVDKVTFSGIPTGAVAKFGVPADQGVIPVADTTINDGTLVVTTKIPGDYTVLISVFPAQDYQVTIHAS